MSGYRVRSYVPDDVAACVAIFESNTPDFFAPDAHPDLLRYLGDPRGDVLVVEHDEAGVVGVGGSYVRVCDDGVLEGRLAWGMVARAWHRRGAGRRLLDARVAALRARGAATVSVRTSERTRGFFERAGFVATRIVPDGVAPGIDVVELTLAP